MKTQQRGRRNNHPGEKLVALIKLEFEAESRLTEVGGTDGAVVNGQPGRLVRILSELKEVQQTPRLVVVILT
jgi:hypothetical protein